MKILLSLILLFCSTTLLAHPGHGVEGVVHDAVHFTWLLAAVALGAIVMHKLPRSLKEKLRKK